MSVYYAKSFKVYILVSLPDVTCIPSRGETATGSRAISPSARLQGGLLPLDLKLQIPHYLGFY